MDANTILTYPSQPSEPGPVPLLKGADTLPRVLAALAASPALEAEVEDAGTLTARQVLAAASAMLPYSPDGSELTAVCAPDHYSASEVARAVEDADAHLLSLLAYPGEGGELAVYVRTDRADPSEVTRSLERHGYTVRRAAGAAYADAALAAERLAELAHYLNV